MDTRTPRFREVSVSSTQRPSPPGEGWRKERECGCGLAAEELPAGVAKAPCLPPLRSRRRGMASGGHGGGARRLQISSVGTKILCQVIPRVSLSLSWSRTSSQVSLKPGRSGHG